MGLLAEIERKMIVNEIEQYVAEHGDNWKRWYVGIAKNAEQRLFSDHKVDRESNDYIHKEASTSEIAREVERYLLKTHDCEGGTGGGDDDTRMVYAYLIKPKTEK